MNTRLINWQRWQMADTVQTEGILQKPATIRLLLFYAQNKLTGSASARLDSEILLSTVTGYPREYLYSHPETSISPSHLADFNSLLVRRAAGYPVAYLTGQREFWSVPLLVNPNVLIPRPETEGLVETALELAGRKTNLNILDLGTGCGAIAIAIAREKPLCGVTATDISSEALSLAGENAAINDVSDISFRISDWFSELRNTRYDIILCNPPYVESTDPYLTEGDLRYEPRLALDGGTHGLDAYQKIIPAARRHLNENGHLILEHGCNQAGAVRRLLEHYHYKNISTRSDCSDLERVTHAVV